MTNADIRIMNDIRQVSLVNFIYKLSYIKCVYV